MKYALPIQHMENAIDSWFQDHNEQPLSDDDIARDLTAYYRLLEKQAKCKHGKPNGYTYEELDKNGKVVQRVKLVDIYKTKCCQDCGADLTKGSDE